MGPDLFVFFFGKIFSIPLLKNEEVSLFLLSYSHETLRGPKIETPDSRGLATSLKLQPHLNLAKKED